MSAAKATLGGLFLLFMCGLTMRFFVVVLPGEPWLGLSMLATLTGFFALARYLYEETEIFDKR